MSCKNLILSTPDLRHTPLTQHLECYYEHVFIPRLEPLKAYKSDSLDSQIMALHQKILMGQQKNWYQRISMSDDWLQHEHYQQALHDILGQLEQKDWLLHDPLLVHFLPIWVSKLESPSITFYYSEPLECARTLQQRWRFPIAFGLALWEHYVLAACKNLPDTNFMLISSNTLRNSPEDHLKPLLDKLGVAHPNDWSVFSNTERPNQADKFTSLQQNQENIFAALQANDLSALRSLSVSDESHDILDYYGQVRSGFEIVKAERDRLQSELELSKNKISIEQVESINTQAAPNTEDSLEEPESALCQVRVTIDGMETLEFFADPSSPVLDMLRNHLVSNEHDELIYLNYGDSDNDTLYFMSSNLLAMETQPVP